jgi:pimeloyl-ACP methyl ester carboxylesterase
MKRRLFKYLVIVAALFMLMGSCLQFRYTDRKQRNELDEIGEKHTVIIDKIKVSERELHYTLVKAADSLPTAVFVHGSPGSSSNFIQYAKDNRLLSAYNVLLVDRPGFGYSGFGDSEPLLSKQATLMNGLLDSLEITQRVLVGHSLGGPIICQMAMHAPKTTKALLIVAGSVSAELEPKEPWRKPLSSRALRWILPKSFRTSNDEILETKGELIRMEKDWSKVFCKVTILQGKKDRLVPYENAIYAERKLVNAKEVKVKLLDNENHFIPFTKPELITKELLAFEIE